MSMVGGHMVGVVANKPRLKQQSHGGAVVNFTVESTPRRFDNVTNRWSDAEVVSLRCNAWNEMAENISESLNKGDHVLLIGRMRNNKYTDPAGVVHEFVEFDIDAMGLDMRYHSLECIPATN